MWRFWSGVPPPSQVAASKTNLSCSLQSSEGGYIRGYIGTKLRRGGYIAPIMENGMEKKMENEMDLRL